MKYIMDSPRMSNRFLVCVVVVFAGVWSVVTETANAQQTYGRANNLSRERLDVCQASLTLLNADLFLFHFVSAGAATIVVRTMRGSYVSEIRCSDSDNVVGSHRSLYRCW